MSKVAVITGASGGIGHFTAKAFAENGYTVYAISRKAGTLDTVNYLQADVTDEDSVKAAFTKILAQTDGAIDILVNNAGTGISGAVEFTELRDALYQLDVNLLGTVRCIQCVLPAMRKRGGNIVNISSVAAIFPLPFQAFYSLSKTAVNSLTLALRSELRTFPIGVCSILPGDAKTGFTAARRKNDAGDALYGGIIAPTVAGMEKDEDRGKNPEIVGRQIFKIATKRRLKPFYATEFIYSLAIVLERFLPKRFVSFIVGKLYVKRPD
jgi:NAD(P)-dependent dehydrogenase (short-subunit alcohol dehydrogenase family)